MGIDSNCESAHEADALSHDSRSRFNEAEARTAGEGPHVVGIDSNCESAHEADGLSHDSRSRFNEAEARAAGSGAAS